MSTRTVDRPLVEVGARDLLTAVSQVVSPGGLGSGRSQKNAAVHRCEIHLCENGGSQGLRGGLSSGEPQAKSSPCITHPGSPSRSNSHAAIDWGKMAEQWLQEKEAERRKQKQRLTPRPSPSPMIESTPMSIAGDATPLLDEMDR